MSLDKKATSAIDEYLNEVEDEDTLDWESMEVKGSGDEWFEQQAAAFLASEEIDPTMQEILDATKTFTRKNFSLRAGLLYRQQLQNTPDYETVAKLEPELLKLAGEANWLADHAPFAHDQQAAYDARQQGYHQWLIAFAMQTLLPLLEGSKVVKVTRSTKKPKNVLSKCPPSLLAQLGIKYKQLLEQHILPERILTPLVESQPAERIREWLGALHGKDTAPPGLLLGLLWSVSERRQWAHGLVEYATALVELVTHAQALDPTLTPRKYLCYYQKKSEATLYRGQDELHAMVENMRADKLLPSVAEGETMESIEDSHYEEWYQGNVKHVDPPADLEEYCTADVQTTIDPAELEPAPTTAPEAPLSALERIRARRKL